MTAMASKIKISNVIENNNAARANKYCLAYLKRILQNFAIESLKMPIKDR